MSQDQKYAIFDFGAVLFNTSRTELYKELFARKGHSDEKLQSFLNDVFTKAEASKANLGNMADVTKALAEKHPAWADEILEFNADRSFLGQIRGLVDGMPDILAQAKAKGHKLFGLTNWAGDTFDALAKAYPQIVGQLDDVVVSGKVGIKKPNPEIFKLAARQFGIRNPAQAYYFDDKAGNIEAAERTVGWHGVVFPKQGGAALAAAKLGL